MTIVVTDATQRIYRSPIPTDTHFSLFKAGLLLQDGVDFVFGPDAGDVTLSTDPLVGDVLEFRRL